MTSPTRRSVTGGLVVGALIAGGPARAAAAGGPSFGPTEPFSFEILKARAKAQAAQPYRAPVPRAGLQNLDFDAIGAVQYRADAALWRDLPGETAIEFFHLSRYAATPVKIH